MIKILGGSVFTQYYVGKKYCNYQQIFCLLIKYPYKIRIKKDCEIDKKFLALY